MTSNNSIQLYAVLLSFLFLLSMPLAFIDEDLAVVRTWQIPLNVLFLVIVIWKRNGHFTWDGDGGEVSRPVLALLAGASLAAFLFCGVSHYLGFQLNAIDFSIFDWMLYNTNHRSFMTSPACGGLNHFGIHQTWVMLPLVPLHRLIQTPYLLIVTHALVLWSACLPLWKLSVRYLKSEALALLVVAAFLTNAWTGRILNYGFHSEVFYVPAGLFLVWGWVGGRPKIWLPALLVFLATKEDASLYMICFAAGILLFERPRWCGALWILLLSAALLALNAGLVQPLVLERTGQADPRFLSFWGDYGASIPEIMKNIILSPGKLFLRVLGSAWYEPFGVFLFLPLLSRRPLPAILSVVAVLGSTRYEVMRSYNVYYSAPLLPFLFWGLLESWDNLPRLRVTGSKRSILFACVLLVAPLLSSGYLRHAGPRCAVLRDVEAFRQDFADAVAPVCAQASVFPHLPYRWDVRLLSEENLVLDGAVGVVHPDLVPYPYTTGKIEAWARGGTVLRRYPSGLVAFRPPNPLPAE